MEQYTELATPRADDAVDPEDPTAFVALDGGDEAAVQTATSQVPTSVMGPSVAQSVAKQNVKENAVQAVHQAAEKGAAAIKAMTSKVMASGGGGTSSDRDQSYEELEDEEETADAQPSATLTAVTAAAAAVTEMTTHAFSGQVEDQYEQLVTPRPPELELHSAEDPGFVALADENGLAASSLSPRAHIADMEQLCPGDSDARSLHGGSRLRWIGKILVVEAMPGRSLYIGPHWPCSIVMQCLILGVGCFFWSQVAPSLGFFHEIMSMIITVGSTAAFLSCALANPGIILPGSECQESARRGTRPKCDVCNIVQPKGSRHCHFCQVCVSGYDHHCPWMGKCIGSKNLKQFYSFLTVGVGSLIYMVVAVMTAPFVGPLVVSD